MRHPAGLIIGIVFYFIDKALLLCYLLVPTPVSAQSAVHMPLQDATMHLTDILKFKKTNRKSAAWLVEL